MKKDQRTEFRRLDEGVALILVLLAILVLSTLAAAMVFSARSETFASYNYRIGTGADFVANAGVQKALNFLESSSYAPVNPLDTTANNVSYVYNVATGGPPSPLCGSYNTTVLPYANLPVCLFFASASPVTCQSGVTNCSTNGPVKLAPSGSNYPASQYTNNVDVVDNWVNALANQTVSDGMGGTGKFNVTALLLNYRTINSGQYGTPDPNCASNDPYENAGICRQASEIWQITSTGTWNSNVGAGGVEPSVQVVATIAPFYVPYTANAFAGLCSVTFNGGGCTDSYGSGGGSYTGTANSCVTTGTGSSNAQASGGGVASNGSVTAMSGSYQIGGNVTFSNSNPSCPGGFSGKASGVTGTIQPGPAIPTPQVPSMAGYPSSTPTVTPAAGGGVTNVYLGVNGTSVPVPMPPTGATNSSGSLVTSDKNGGCPGHYTGNGDTTPPSNSYAYLETFDWSYNGTTNSYTNYNCISLTGNGTSASPVLLGDVTANSTYPGTINVVSPVNPLTSPIRIDANSLTSGTNGILNTVTAAPLYPLSGSYNPNGGTLPTSDSNASALSMAIYGNLSIGGTGDINYNPSLPGVPSPGYLTLYVEGTTVSLTGQATLSAVIIAPNASATLSGSGSGGTFFGSIMASNVTDKGKYAVHYDRALNSLSGNLFNTQIVSVTRKVF